MKTKTGLWALGMFTLAGAVTISCGSSDDDDDSGPTGGTSSTAGSSTGGSATGGTANPGAGTSTTAGTATGGTSNPGGGTNGTAGTNNNQAGDGPGPGAGGDGNAPGCPATMPTDGSMCTQQQGGGFQGCPYGDQTCRCQRMGGGQMRRWNCDDAMGAGGGGPGGGTVTCPADAMNDDECTGTGLCPGQQCACFNDNVTCF